MADNIIVSFEEFKEIAKPIELWYKEALAVIFSFTENPTVETMETMSQHLLAHPGSEAYVRYTVLMKMAEEKVNEGK